MQEHILLNPYQSLLTDSKIKFLIPPGYLGQITVNSDQENLNLYIFPGVIENDYTDTIKLVIRNLTNETIALPIGSSVAQLLIIPVVQPELKDKNETNTENSSFGHSKKLPNGKVSIKKKPKGFGGTPQSN